MKLILGPGARHQKQPGEFLIDCRPFPGVDLVWDLDKHPWPLPDDHAAEIHAGHVVEHLRTLLVPFMDECHRILRPGGSLFIQTPLAGGNVDLEWCDPTHVRMYRRHSFINYFSRKGVSFGYTDKAWDFPVLDTDSLGNLNVQAIPVK